MRLMRLAERPHDLKLTVPALAAVTRVRSLFVSSPEPLPTDGPLDSAAQSTVDAGQRAAGLSGVLVDRHADFISNQAVHLSNAGRTDTTLASQLDSAATLTRNRPATRHDRRPNPRRPRPPPAPPPTSGWSWPRCNRGSAKPTLS